MILLVLLVLLILLIFLCCGDKGVRSIISTTMNIALLFVAIYLIYRGLSPLGVTFISCTAITGITLFYQNEVTRKSKIAFGSVLLVLLLLLPLVYFLASGANAESFPAEQYEITDSNGYTRNVNLPLLSIQISVMIIALLGAVIDTAVAIVASMQEIYERQPALTRKELIQSGFTVSKSILNTSIHTIFYIYFAEYLTLFIQYMTDYSFVTILNSTSLAKEIISIAISGTGICLVVPVATLLGAYFIKKEQQPDAATQDDPLEL